MTTPSTYYQQVNCRGCKGKRISQYKMRIYDCSTDKFFHKQKCKDKHDGVVRDKEGFIIEELEDAKQ